MSQFNARLNEEIAAVCPILGVSIGTVGDNGSITILFDPSATAGQITAANAAAAAFDWTQAVQDLWELRNHYTAIGARFGVYKGANQGIVSASYVDVTSLRFPLQKNTKYLFEFAGAYTSSSAIVGAAFSVDGPASPTDISYIVMVGTSATGVNQGAFGSYNAGSAPLLSGGATPMPFALKGTIFNGSNIGYLTLRAKGANGVATITVTKGSIGELTAAS